MNIAIGQFLKATLARKFALAALALILFPTSQAAAQIPQNGVQLTDAQSFTLRMSQPAGYPSQPGVVVGNRPFNQNVPLTDAQSFDLRMRQPYGSNSGIVSGSGGGIVYGSGAGIVYGSAPSFNFASNSYNPYDPYLRYCRQCARDDLQCRRLKRKYCTNRVPNVGNGLVTGGAGIVYGSSAGIVYGSGGFGSGSSGISTSAAGNMTYPNSGTTYNFGVPFVRSDSGNAIAARNLSADYNYKMQLYNWQVARKAAEWQAMKNEQLRHEQEWNDMITRRMMAAAEAKAQADSQKQQVEQTSPPEETPGIAGRFFSIKNNQLLSPSAEPKPAPAPTVEASNQQSNSVLTTPAQKEVRAPRTEAEKASILRQFKRSLFGI